MLGVCNNKSGIFFHRLHDITLVPVQYIILGSDNKIIDKSSQHILMNEVLDLSLFGQLISIFCKCCPYFLE